MTYAPCRAFVPQGAVEEKIVRTRRLTNFDCTSLKERLMSLSVIGAGLSRTGTLSLKLALEYLGFGPCYHAENAFERGYLESLPAWCLWERALDHQSVDWDEIFNGFRSTTDIPGCLFYRELAKKYPSAKVILPVRDPNAWFDSIQVLLSPEFFAVNRSFPSWSMLGKLLTTAFGDRINDRDSMIESYERHNAGVCRVIPADRLLLYDLRQGWAPLCEFLGVPIPDIPFPKTNTTADVVHMRPKFREHMERLQTGRHK